MYFARQYTRSCRTGCANRKDRIFTSLVTISMFLFIAIIAAVVSVNETVPVPLTAMPTLAPTPPTNVPTTATPTKYPTTAAPTNRPTTKAPSTAAPA